MTPFQNFIFTRTYARWLDDKQRREIYDETVDRYSSFFHIRLMELGVDWLAIQDFKAAIEGIRNMETMPSMRALWTAGEALARENLCAYNCAATTINRPEVFAEILYCLLSGTGVGFSVERQFINELPTIPDSIIDTGKIIIFGDSKRGWAEGYKDFVDALYEGELCTCDYSSIRPEGSRLKTFGGRASGPQPLKNLVDFTKNTFLNAAGRKLTSIECHDIACYIASIVVVGGTRRAACISLSNLSDHRMAHAKDGEFWLNNPQRSLANNSTCYTEKPDPVMFLREWLNLMRSQSGERGIVNREGIKKFIAKRTLQRELNHDFVVNPCSEVFLRPNGLCNLTEVVIRSHDSFDDIKAKVKNAVILGCLQTTLDNFKFLHDDWRKNVNEERLLGVSLTGLRDHPVLNHVHDQAKYWLRQLREYAWDVAETWAYHLKINTPAAITCVKPSGTVGLLVDSSPGIHTRFAKYYIRRVRISKTDPLCQMMIDQGIPWQPETGQNIDNFNTAVFDFPQAAPEGAIVNGDIGAIEALEYWLMIKQYWCDMNPSVTIFVKESEWIEVGNWVYSNWDDVTGIAFLPKDENIYPLAPYEEIAKETYDFLVRNTSDIDFNALSEYEQEDKTEGAGELACGGGSCEIP